MIEECKEEYNVLKSIYGEEFTAISESEFALSFATVIGNLTLSVKLPPAYPDEIPLFTLKPDWPIAYLGINESFQVPKDLSSSIFHAFDKIFNESIGNVFLFDCCQKMKELLEDYDFTLYLVDDFLEDSHSLDIVNLDSSFGDNDDKNIFNALIEGCPNVYTATSTIVDRKSVFLGHCAKVYSQKDIDNVVKTLLLNKKIARATHNIIAFKYTDSVTGASRADFSDDGETAAGSRLLHMLRLSKVENVVVIVSRWYGGIQLGTARFKHINNAARAVLDEFKLLL